MKTYIITLSKKFPKGHRKEGEPTLFKEKIMAGEKIHTIRANYDFWAKRFEQVERGEACISIRQWTDKPYRSPQVEIAQLTWEHGIGIQKLYVIKETEAGYIKDKRVTYEELASNDGLTLEEFKEWFKDYNTTKPMVIIHLTKFRYNV